MPFLGAPALAGAGAGGGTIFGGAAATATVTTATAGTAAVSGTTLLTGAAVVVGGSVLLSGDTPIAASSAAAVAAAAPTTPALTPQQLQDRLKKAQDLAKSIAAAAAATCATGNCCNRVVVISRAMSPEAAKHIDDAQATGFPSILTIDRPGAKARGDSSVYGIATVVGYQRDEYPPKVFLENGGVASVRYIPSSDNLSAGAQIRWGIDGAPNGCKVTIKTGP